MTAGHHMRSLRMRQQALKSACEGLCVKDFILAPPDDQGRQLGLRQLRFEPNEPRPGAGRVVKRYPSWPRPGQKTRLAVRQDRLVDGLRFQTEPLAIDDRQIHPPARQDIVPAHQIRPDQGRVHGAPWEQAGVEFRRGRRPRPGAHDGQRAYSFLVAHRKAQAGWSAPVVAHHCQTTQIELADKAGEVGDMPIETMRLLTGRFLGQAKADHVGDDDAVSRIDQRRDHAAVEEAPGRIAMQQQDGVADALIDIVHSPAIDPGVARHEGPLHAKPVEAFKRVCNHSRRLTPERSAGARAVPASPAGPQRG